MRSPYSYPATARYEGHSTPMERNRPARLLVLSLAVWGAVVAQSSLIGPLDPLFQPHLPLLALICGAWMSGTIGGAWLGFWTGLLLSGLSGMFVGSFTFIYLLLGWGIGRVREEIYGDWVILLCVAAGAGSLLAEAVIFLWNPRNLADPILLLNHAGINALLAPLAYFPLTWILRALETRLAKTFG